MRRFGPANATTNARQWPISLVCRTASRSGPSNPDIWLSGWLDCWLSIKSLLTPDPAASLRDPAASAVDTDLLLV